MGSGRMVGGFDGWLGSAPGGGGGGGGGVTQIVAGTGIGVSPAGGTGIVTVSNTGVVGLIAGSGVTIDHPTGTVTIGLDATLASLYQFGLANSPVADNTLVGTRYSMYLDGVTDAIDLTQPTAETGVNSNTDHPSLYIQRHNNTFPTTGLATLYEMFYDQFTQFTFQGGNNLRWQIRTNDNVVNLLQDWTTAVNRPVSGPTSYTPNFLSSDPVTSNLFSILNRRLGGDLTPWYFDSDGILYRRALLPPSGGPFTLYAGQIDMLSSVNGFGSLPQIGSTVFYDSVSVGAGLGEPTKTMFAAGAVFDAQNAGSGQYAGHGTWWARSTLGGPLVEIMQGYDSGMVFPVRTSWSGTLAALSSASSSALSYDSAGTNRLSLSNNAGAYSPVATLADIGPSTGTLVTVDVPSATQDLKTATTFTSVPNVAGRKFLPIAAYVEFTTVTALATGPTLKLGNNGAHDNVAPALAVANTVVTGSAPPFVMASDVVIIDLNTTGIICELTVNAAGTTCQGRTHVIGIYTT